jgi:hypothetical protein
MLIVAEPDILPPYRAAAIAVVWRKAFADREQNTAKFSYGHVISCLIAYLCTSTSRFFLRTIQQTTSTTFSQSRSTISYRTSFACNEVVESNKTRCKCYPLPKAVFQS